MKQKMLRAIAVVLLAATALMSNPPTGLMTEKVVAAEKKAQSKNVKLNKNSITLKKGKKFKLTVKNLSKKAKVKWLSSKKSVVSINKWGGGVIKANKPGKAKITVVITEKGKKTLRLSCKITVKGAAKKKNIIKTNITSMVVSTQTELDEALKNSNLEELNPKTTKWHLAKKKIATRKPGTPDDSNAYRHAKWQPEEGIKGGIFSYAVDRDGAEEGIDATKEKCGRYDPNDNKSISEQSDYYGKWGDNTRHIHTEYKWTKILKKIMLEDENYKEITETDIPDPALRKAIIKQIGKNWRGNLERFGGALLLDDPAITSLEGLNKLINLKKLTLKGLPNVKELAKTMLPESLRPSYHGAPYEKAVETLVLDSMSGLEKLALKGFDLEHLPIKNAAKFTSLKYFDISENKIDFSAGEDKTVLETLYTIVKEKDGNIFIFNLQKPQGYMPKIYKATKIEDPNADEKIPVGGLFAFGVGTANDEVIAESDFNAYKAKTFIDPTYTWEAFKTFENADNNLNQVSFDGQNGRDKVQILDHTSTNVTSGQADGISRKTQETYFLTYSKYYSKMKLYDEKGNFTGEGEGYRNLHTCKIVVGEELERLTNFAFGAKVLKMSFTDSNFMGVFPSRVIGNLFNGKILEEKNASMLAVANSPSDHWVVFDIKKSEKISSWFVNNSYIDPGSSTPIKTVKKGELWYFAGAGTPSDSDMTDDAKWMKADAFDETSPIAEYSKNFNSPISARYWKYKVKDFSGLLCISEIQLKGKESQN